MGSGRSEDGEWDTEGSSYDFSSSSQPASSTRRSGWETRTSRRSEAQSTVRSRSRRTPPLSRRSETIQSSQPESEPPSVAAVSSATPSDEDTQQAPTPTRRPKSPAALVGRTEVVVTVESAGSTTTAKEKRKPEETTEELELRFGARHMVLLFVPVSVTMGLSLAVIQVVGRERELVGSYSARYSELTPFGEEGGGLLGLQTTGSAVGDALLNAAVFLGFIVLLTVLVVVLFVYRCYKTLAVALAGMMSLGIFVVTGNLMIARFFRALNSTLWNGPLMGLWSVNFGVVGPLAVFWKAPPRLTQAAICAGTAITATMLTLMLRKWAAWLILGLLALWDVFAVCAPCGPLRILVNKAAERQAEGVQFGKGMLYETLVWLGADGPPAEEEETELSEGTSAKLGLGDFVFYSILLCKCSNLAKELHDDWDQAVDWASTAGVAVSILVGLCLTLLYLSVKQKPLPALPVSILLGLAVSFGSFFTGRPLLLAAAAHQAFL